MGALSVKNKFQIPIQVILLLIMAVARRWAFDPFEKHAMAEAKKIWGNLPSILEKSVKHFKL